MPRRKQPDALAAKVGLRIRALRMERGMSMAAMAEAAGVSKGHVTNIERGLAQTTVGTLVATGRALGLAPSLLLVFPGEEPLGSVLEHLRVSEDAAAEQALLAMAPPPKDTPRDNAPLKRGRRPKG
jgi:transcriptional regulator with XRE-family HTH domain